MDVVALEQVVKQYINLPPNASGTGWFQILCKVCNDSGRKGARAGFKFDSGKVAYHCFNCGHATVYDPETQKGMPEKMVAVLTAFGVPEDQWKQVLITGLANRDKGLKSTKSDVIKPFEPIEPMEVPLPSHFYPLAEASPNDTWAQVACEYLDGVRGVDPKSYPFFLADKTDDPKLNRWHGRVIIPVYKDGRLIFYTGRDLTEKKIKKYLNPSYSKEKVMYGYSEIFRKTDEPLYIVEGWFDAYAVNGVAIFGNEISSQQQTWLNKSQRKKVYIPDRLGNGHLAANQALEYGWSIATPGLGSWSGDIKDMNDAVKKYGKVFVMKSLAESTTSGFAAQTKLGLYCNGKTDKNSSKEKNRRSPKA